MAGYGHAHRVTLAARQHAVEIRDNVGYPAEARARAAEMVVECEQQLEKEGETGE